MIVHFPQPYPDELFYSVLARYYCQSGYMAYTFAAQDLFERKTVKPSLEFLSPLSLDVRNIIENTITFPILVEKHTMFPYYARFLTLERRLAAYESLMAMENNCCNSLCYPKSKSGRARYLRYCPICAAENRDSYGETYWPRAHQMTGVNICPVHSCYLVESDIPISSNGSPSLITAEEAIPQKGAVSMCGNEIQSQVASYVYRVFLSAVDLQSDISVGAFLHFKMENTKYLSVRGEQRNMTLLCADFCDYYRNLPDNDFNELWKLQKVFTNDRYSSYEICLLAMFLNVSVEELTNMKLPEQSQMQRFDEKIRELHKQGLKYPEIAKRMNASYHLVKAIGTGKYGTYHYTSADPQKGGAKKLDWQSIDADTLPKVKALLNALTCDDIARPQRISIGKVERVLGLPSKRLQNCPKCKAEIEKHLESQEEYWAREIVWAVGQLMQDGRPLNFSGIHRLINLRKKDMKRCLPYLSRYASKELASCVTKILEE